MPRGLFSGTMYATEMRMSCIAKQGVCRRNIILNTQGRCLRLTIAHFSRSLAGGLTAHSPQNRPTCVSICGIKFDLTCRRSAGRRAGGSADPNPTARVKGQTQTRRNSSQIHPKVSLLTSVPIYTNSPCNPQNDTKAPQYHTHTHTQEQVSG